jgi:hypothetical protein
MRYEGKMSLLEQLLYDVGGESMDREDLKALPDARMLFSRRVREEPAIQKTRWSPLWT